MFTEKFKHLNLSTKISLVMCGLITLLLLVSLICVHQFLSLQIEQSFQTEQEQSQNTVDALIHEQYVQLKKGLSAVVDSPEIKALLSYKHIDHQTLLNCFSNLNDILQTDMLLLVDPKGELKVRTDHPFSRGINLSQIPIFKQGLQGKPSAGFWDITGTPHLVFIHPVYVGDSFKGCVLGGLNFGLSLQKKINHTLLRDVVVLKDNQIISSTLNPESQTEFAHILHPPEAEKSQTSLQNLIINQQKIIVQTIPITQLDDMPIAMDIQVLTMIPEKKILGFYHRLKNTLLGTGSVVFLLGIGLSFWLSRKIVKRLERITHLMDLARKNNNFEMIDFDDGNDEVGRLSSTFLAMRKEINRQIFLLERQNETANELRELAEEANQTKSQFLANMSHEIRTPMTAILGFTDVLKEQEQNPDKISSLETIKRNGEYLLQLINDILDVSKIESGKLELEKIECSPAQIVSDIEALLKVKAEEKELEIKMEFEGPIPQFISSDPTRLKQVLLNLVSNAIKFSKTGPIRIITQLINEHSNQPQLQMEVIDKGIGMDKEQMAKVFEPFSQANSSTTRKFGGTGLGLTICKRLAEMMGGSINPICKLNEGCAFRLLIPVVAPPRGLKLVELNQESLKSTNQNKIQQQIKTIPDCHLLLAEDSTDNQRLISYVLRKAGAEVTIAENGQKALDLATEATEQNKPFDVILMDIQMPVMDGFMATAALREQNYDGPIIALTAHAMQGDQEKCLRAGFDNYATKPIEREKLISMIQFYLECRSEEIESSESKV